MHYTLQIYSQQGLIPGSHENQQFIPLHGPYNIYPMGGGNKFYDSENPVPADVRYVVHYNDILGENKTAWVRETDSAFILNSEGKTFRTIHRPR